MWFFRWALFLSSIVGFTAEGDSGEIRVPWIEPLADVLPANFLKFYLHFPAPMERGDVFRYIRLVRVTDDGSEEEVLEPFREVELWSADFLTQTLWLHPGRQKPGVNLNVELGPVLEAGNHYRLVVSENWKTEKGNKLGLPMVKEFRAGPAEYSLPDPQRWSISISGDRAKVLRITTEEDIDPASLRKRLRIVNSKTKKQIAFESEVLGRQIRIISWLDSTFRTAWVPGPYYLEVDSRLEDLAGNSIARPFNLDLEKHPDFLEKTEPVEIHFTISEDHEVTQTTP